MVRRGEITDRAWQEIEPLLPEYGHEYGQSGGQWREHRTVFNGILWKLGTGSPWRDLPERYGPWRTCFDRFDRWRRDGTWDRLLAQAQTKSDAVGEIEWEVSVDDTVIRAHQHAAGARGERAGRKKGLLNPEDEALGRGGGGFSTKPHLARDGKGGPLSVVCSPPASATAAPNSRSCSTPCGWGALWAKRADPASGPPTCWPTGATATSVVEGCRAGAASPTHPRAQGPEGAPGRAPGTPARFRAGGLPWAQRGGEVRE